MADVVASEAISKAVVSERIGANPRMGSDKAVAAEMIKRANESNWRESLTFSAETQVNRDEVLGRVDQIGSERDASGKRTRSAGSPEEKRFNDATRAAELALKLGEKGYDGLTPGEKTTVTDSIKRTVLQNPSLSKEFNGLNPAKKQEFLERIARDKSYAKEVNSALKTFSEGEVLDNSASVKQDALDQARIDQAVKQSELDDTQRRLDAIDVRLKAFDITATPPGAQAQEMERIRANLTTLQAEAANFQQEMDDKNFRLGQLQQERQAALQGQNQARGGSYTGRSVSDIDVDIATVRGELQTSTSNYNSRAAEINKLPQLEQQEQKLEQDRVELAKEKGNKENEKSKADIIFSKAQRELQDALDRRTRQEEEIVASLEGVFSTATMELIDKQIEAYGQQFEESLKHVNTEGMSADQKAVIAALEQRWVKVINKRRFGGRTEPRRVIDKAKVNIDFNTLMAGGTEIYMRDVLSEAINPATGAIYTPAEIDKLIKSEDFVNTAQPEAIKQLIARKAVVGGIEPSDVYQITHSSWGQEVIGGAIKTNEDFRKAVSELMGENALDDPNFMQRLANEAENHPSLLATLATALVAGIGVATGAGVVGIAGAGAAGVGTLGGAMYRRGSKMFG